MFYLLPAAGTSETPTGTCKNRLPEVRHTPIDRFLVAGSWYQLLVPETG